MRELETLAPREAQPTEGPGVSYTTWSCTSPVHLIARPCGPAWVCCGRRSEFKNGFDELPNPSVRRHLLRIGGRAAVSGRVLQACASPHPRLLYANTWRRRRRRAGSEARRWSPHIVSPSCRAAGELWKASGLRTHPSGESCDWRRATRKSPTDHPILGRRCVSISATSRVDRGQYSKGASLDETSGAASCGLAEAQARQSRRQG